MSDEQLYAVLSGDIVESRRFVDRGPALRDAIKSAYRTCADAFPEALRGLPEVDVFAGDSWQILTDSPTSALRIALCMRALIKSNAELPGVDTRVAIGVGTIGYLGDDRLSMSQGEAFTLSGVGLRELEAVDACRLAALAASTPAGGQQGALAFQRTLDTVMLLLDVICEGWTASQAAAMACALRGWTQTQSAHHSGISQPAVSKALCAAKERAVREAVSWWEHAFRTAVDAATSVAPPRWHEEGQ